MVFLTQVEIPCYGGLVRQHGRGLGALAQNFEITLVPFLRKNIVPAAIPVGADLLQFTALKVAEVVSGR